MKTQNNAFGTYLREKRLAMQASDPDFSLRRLAGRIGVEPSFLSKVERGETAPPSEGKIICLAEELGEDPDVLLALGGKISSELQVIIRKRPALFAQLIRDLKDMPDHAVLRLVRDVPVPDW